jgi:hypothetical protein
MDEKKPERSTPVERPSGDQTGSARNEAGISKARLAIKDFVTSCKPWMWTLAFGYHEGRS